MVGLPARGKVIILIFNFLNFKVIYLSKYYLKIDIYHIKNSKILELVRL